MEVTREGRSRKGAKPAEVSFSVTQNGLRLNHAFFSPSVLRTSRILYAGHDFASDSVASSWVAAPGDPARGAMMATTHLIRVQSVFNPLPLTVFWSRLGRAVWPRGAGGRGVLPEGWRLARKCQHASSARPGCKLILG